MRNLQSIQTFLPQPLRYEAGTRADLAGLLRHHYRAALPATLAAVRIARTREARSRRWRVVGVAALSWPVPLLKVRNRLFAVSGYGPCLQFANANVRTISRVIVHPQFRAAGIAQELVRQLVDACPTRYIESSTSMGAFAGFLTRAGFTAVPVPRGEPAYFLLDRLGTTPDASDLRIEPD